MNLLVFGLLMVFAVVFGLQEDEILRELMAENDHSLNLTNLHLQTQRIRRPIKCKDNRGCRKWLKKKFCTDRRFNEGTKALLCPVACGYCDFKEKPFATFERNMNEKADPCQSFFEFTCGKLNKNFPARPGMNFGAAYDMNNNVRQVLQRELQWERWRVAESVFQPSPSTAVKKMQNFFMKCMDLQSINQIKTTKLREEITKMGGCPMLDGAAWNRAKWDLTTALTDLAKYGGFQILFVLTSRKPDAEMTIAPALEPPNMMLKNPVEYQIPAARPKVEALRTFLADVISYVAFDAKSSRTFKEISDAVDQFMDLEQKIGAIATKYHDYRQTMAKVIREDKSKYSKLSRIVPVIDWPKYIVQNPLITNEIRSHLNADPDFFYVTEQLWKEVSQLIAATDKGVLANYLMGVYILNRAEELDSRFHSAAARFAQTVDGKFTSPQRDDNCLESTIRHFVPVVDFTYLKKAVSAKKIAKASQMVEDLRAAILEMLRHERWMDPTTRQRAMDKIRKTKKIIAGVPAVLNQAALDAEFAALLFDPKDTFYEMDAKVHMFQNKQNMEKLTQNVDKVIMQELGSQLSADVNAFHAPNINYIMIKGGIMQMPIFDDSLPAAINYGGLGAIVGHEFTHGIDPNGAKFDAQGLKKDWWAPATLNQFNNRAKCLVDLYGSKIEPKSNMRVNGNVSVGENTADHGGVRAAFSAYKKYLRRNGDKHLPGYRRFSSEKLFFLSYAMFFCTSRSAQSERFQIETDDHAPDRFRIDLTLANFPQFAKTFKCRRGTPMNPNKRCTVW